jgi:hypothetical protein
VKNLKLLKLLSIFLMTIVAMSVSVFVIPISPVQAAVPRQPLFASVVHQTNELTPYGAVGATKIDPQSQINASYWTTFLGGTAVGYSLGLDGRGNIYVTGYSDYSWGNPVQPFSGSRDTFVAEVDNSGNLIWNTFLKADYGMGITVDSNGNIYVTGLSDTSWGNPLRAFSGGTTGDSYVAKLDNNGNLLWNTFLGPSAYFVSSGITIDGNGNIFVTGTSTNSWGNPVRAFAGGAWDAFAAKLNSSGNLIWNSFLGGSDADEGHDIAVDDNGNVYVAGSSWSTWGSPLQAYVGDGDAFASKLDGNGNLIWNTFLGGVGADAGSGIAVDKSGNVYVDGSSSGTWGNPVRAYTAGVDTFAAKLNNNGNLTWNTFLGGSGDDPGWGITVDNSENVYVAGRSSSSWGSTLRAYTASTDGFAAKINSNGQLIWNTFLGGSGDDFCSRIIVDGNGNLYTTGYSTTSWGSPVRAFGHFDAFVAKLDSSGGLITTPATTSLPNTTTPITVTTTSAATTALSQVAPPPPSYVSPSNDASVSSIPTLSWRSNGGTSYTFSVILSFNNQNVQQSPWITGTSWQPSGPLEPGWYAWHVLACNQSGVTSDASSAWMSNGVSTYGDSFWEYFTYAPATTNLSTTATTTTTTTTSSSQIAPPPPSYVSPSNDASVSSIPTLSWRSNGGTSYTFSVILSNGSQNVQQSPWITGTSWQVSGPLAPGGYAWHVLARNQAGVTSDASSSWSNGVSSYGDGWWESFTYAPVTTNTPSTTKTTTTTRTTTTTTSAPLNWTVSLSVSNTHPQANQSITLTATTNHDVGPTQWGLYIFDTTTNALVAKFPSGTSGSSSPLSYAGETHNFVARIGYFDGSQTQITSNTVSVTWANNASSVATVLKLLDYSFSRPDPAYIKSMGYKGVLRYLAPLPNSKVLTADECKALHNAGLVIGLVWESSASRANDGKAAGVQDAQAALAQANSLGVPSNIPIYFAIDWDATEAQQTNINAYFDGIHSVFGSRKVGAYGGYYVIKRLFDASKINYGWQTYAWSGGQWDSRAQIRQTLNGQWSGQVDFDETTTSDWGGW